MFVQALKGIIESLSHRGTLPQHSSGKFPEVTPLVFEKEDELRAEESRTM